VVGLAGALGIDFSAAEETLHHGGASKKNPNSGERVGNETSTYRKDDLPVGRRVASNVGPPSSPGRGIKPPH
jgi:hypothetical protein